MRAMSPVPQGLQPSGEGSGVLQVRPLGGQLQLAATVQFRRRFRCPALPFASIRDMMLSRNLEIEPMQLDADSRGNRFPDG